MLVNQNKIYAQNASIHNTHCAYCIITSYLLFIVMEYISYNYLFLGCDQKARIFRIRCVTWSLCSNRREFNFFF